MIAARPEPVCPDCHAAVLREPHVARCPTKAPWRVLRLAVTPEGRRAEDELEAVTRKAYRAATRAGGRP